MARKMIIGTFGGVIRCEVHSRKLQQLYSASHWHFQHRRACAENASETPSTIAAIFGNGLRIESPPRRCQLSSFVPFSRLPHFKGWLRLLGQISLRDKWIRVGG